MDSNSGFFYDSLNGHESFSENMSPRPEDLLSYADLFNYKDPSDDPSSIVSPALQTDNSDSDLTLKYISQVLMEENMDDNPSMFHDPLALQAVQKPFFDALGHDYPLSPNQHPFVDHFVNSPTENLSGSSDEQDGIQVTCNSNSTSSINTTDSLDSAPSMTLGPNIFSDRESMLQFQKGVEEANKFLPKTTNLVVDLGNITFPEELKESSAVLRPEEDHLSRRQRIRKFQYLDDGGDFAVGRSNKLSAISVEEADELTERFDEVLLCRKIDGVESYQKCKILSQVLQQQGSNERRDGKRVVDLRTLLILGAQAAASDDRRTAYELLKQIRQHSSPLGDGSQRLAHFFANALEARLAGTGSDIYTALANKRITAAQKLEAFQLFVSACPFKRISVMFANLNILKVAGNTRKIHVIDFGILYGFQWPSLIQLLSERYKEPPVLRITGIEFPQPGFKPAERVEKTGRRLAKYCERFGVPFEFHAIAQNWETIKIEDLKIVRGETLVANCLFRLKNLLDETVAVDCPRDAVLNLIRQIKPDLFAHAVVNGSFNAPFFVTRFREALFHYSTLFDMFDTNIPRGNQDRLMFEREFYGREIMNVVACEGTERVERPETHKQWQVKHAKSGFRQLPLDPEMTVILREEMKCYSKDYSFDVDGNWTLMGWKGRVAFAASAWVPWLASNFAVKDQ